MAQTAQLASRRDRVRAATSQEILQTARRLLVERGSTEISLRAIAREMGMTAPALYRYYDSHETLIQHVVADIFTDLADYLEAAIAAEPARGQAEPAEVAAQLIAACRAFRDWAIAHRPEFGLVFGTPLPDVDLYHDNPLVECGMRMGAIFLRLFGDLWRLTAFPAPADDQIDAALRVQVARYREHAGPAASDLPLGVLLVFLRCWVLLYGTVAMEVFGHMRFAVEDPAELFELVLADLAAMVGLG